MVVGRPVVAVAQPSLSPAPCPPTTSLPDLSYHCLLPEVITKHGLSQAVRGGQVHVVGTQRVQVAQAKGQVSPGL